MNNRKWKDHSTSGEYKFVPKVVSEKRIQSLNHQLPGKLVQFEFRDGTDGEFTSSRGTITEGKRKNGGGNSLLSEILLKASNLRKERTSTRKRRSIEDVNSGSELPSGVDEEGRSGHEFVVSESTLSGQNLTTSGTSENNTSGQGLSGQESSGSESAGNETFSGHIDTYGPESFTEETLTDDASSGSTLSENGSTISGHLEVTTPRTFSPLPVDGEDVCNTCRGASEYKLLSFYIFRPSA